ASHDPGTWGRYISNLPNPNDLANFPGGGPESDINFTINDPDKDLLKATAEFPAYGTNVDQGLPVDFKTAPTATAQFPYHDFQFWHLFPTASNNPNLIRIKAVDIYGLESSYTVQHIQVMPRPSWETSLKWDNTKKQYQLGFHNRLIDFGDPKDPI